MTTDAGDPVWRSEHSTSRYAFIAALQYEAGVLRQSGVSADRVFVSGPGSQAAQLAARRALQAGARGLIAWGLAGGLQAAAPNGTVLLPERVIGSDGERETAADWRQQLVELLADRFVVAEGALCTVAATVTTPDARREIAARTGAVAVDMESAAIAAVAADAACPFVALRVVADDHTDRLPDRVDSLVTADGNTRLAGLLPLLIAPGQLRLLLQLGRQSQRARQVLGAVAAAIVESTA